jgi:hypothetical protein
MPVAPQLLTCCNDAARADEASRPNAKQAGKVVRYRIILKISRSRLFSGFQQGSFVRAAYCMGAVPVVLSQKFAKLRNAADTRSPNALILQIVGRILQPRSQHF